MYYHRCMGIVSRTLWQEFCVLYNDWLQADTYFWVERLVTTSSAQEWANVVTVESKDAVHGSWTAKVEISPAIRAFAAAKGKKIQQVTEKMVAQSDLGIKGYASLYDSLPAAAPKPGGDGTNAPPPPAPPSARKRTQEDDGDDEGQKAKGSSNTKKPRIQNTTAKYEKEVKEFLAMEQRRPEQRFSRCMRTSRISRTSRWQPSVRKRWPSFARTWMISTFPNYLNTSRVWGPRSRLCPRRPCKSIRWRRPGRVRARWFRLLSLRARHGPGVAQSAATRAPACRPEGMHPG